MLRLYEGVRVSVYGGTKRKHLEEKNQDPRSKNQIKKTELRKKNSNQKEQKAKKNGN